MQCCAQPFRLFSRAPSSTKDKKKQCDPDMRQSKNGNQWYFGMKAHIGVDTETKLIHSVVATGANVHDSVVIGDLLHGEEELVFGDSAYSGKGDAINEAAPNALDLTQKKGSRHQTLTEAERDFNRRKSRVRARVELAFGIMKGQFGFRKVRYKGLVKNAHYLFTTCALINLVMAKEHLLKQRSALQG